MLDGPDVLSAHRAQKIVVGPVIPKPLDDPVEIVIPGLQEPGAVRVRHAPGRHPELPSAHHLATPQNALFRPT